MCCITMLDLVFACNIARPNTTFPAHTVSAVFVADGRYYTLCTAILMKNSEGVKFQINVILTMMCKVYGHGQKPWPFLYFVISPAYGTGFSLSTCKICRCIIVCLHLTHGVVDIRDSVTVLAPLCSKYTFYSDV